MARGIEQIVNERVLAWEAERRSTVPPPSSQVRQAPVEQRPIVTISRMCGSLGGALGRAVAEKLGFAFYSQELVHKIATAARVQSDTVDSLDEQTRGGLEVMVREIIEGEAFAPNDYLYHLRNVLGQVGREGRSVVIGRGAHLILDPTLTLRVRTYAPLEKRVANVIEREHVSRDDALALLRRIDRERAAFYRKSFNVDWNDPDLFDITLNTASLPLAECAEIVAAAYATRF